MDAGVEFHVVGALLRMHILDAGGGGDPGVVVASGDFDLVGGAVQSFGASQAEQMTAGFEVLFRRRRGEG